MKRERDNSLVDDDEIGPRDGSNRTFRINNSESSSSNPSNNIYDSASNNKEQDRFLPIANVGRIMKKVIPGNGKISKDAKETVQECVSEFISFVTCEASDKCQREKRKTINGDDILWAIMTLGFEDYATPLKVYLNKYREVEGEKLNVPKQQQQQQQSCIDQQQQQNNNSSNLGYNNVYSSGNIMNQGSFMSGDQMAFPLNFSQGPMHGGRLPQQDHQLDDHW